MFTVDRAHLFIFLIRYIIKDSNGLLKLKAFSMKKVSIQPGCITCGLCEFLAPEIFEVTDVSRVKEDAPTHEHHASIKEAAVRCPVQVISYEEDTNHETTNT